MESTERQKVRRQWVIRRITIGALVAAVAWLALLLSFYWLIRELYVHNCGTLLQRLVTPGQFHTYCTVQPEYWTQANHLATWTMVVPVLWGSAVLVVGLARERVTLYRCLMAIVWTLAVTALTINTVFIFLATFVGYRQ